MATRTERVVLELEDNFTTGMAKAAAATALLKRELGGLDGSNQNAARSTRQVSDETDRLSTRAVRGRSEIDRFSGRLTVLAQAAAGLGPALVPIGAVGIPAVAGLANELGAAALGAGTALLAFHGLGDAVGALNKAALDPTVTNLEAAQLALDKLPPAARAFAQELSSLTPTLDRLRQAAAAGLFPGLEDSLNTLRTRSHDVEKILFQIGDALGDLSRKGAEALAGPEWDRFFKFIAQEAPQALADMGEATGAVVHGLAQLWMAFAPLNHDFAAVIIDAANGFDRWASGLAKTQGFADFIAYLHTNGPIVADAVIAIANAVLKIVEAAAPLGGPILQALTGVANAVATIADSPAGPTILAAVTALSLLARAQSTFGRISSASWVQAIKGADTYQSKLAAARGPAIRGGLALAGLGLAASGVADKFHLANTATLALTGSIAGPWGAAAGAGVGLMLDLASSSKKYDLNSQELTATLDQQTGAITQNTAQWAAQQLEQSGLLARGQEFGLSVRQITGYVLGQKDATEQVNAAMDKFDTGQRIIVGRGASVGQALSGQASSAASFADALNGARDSAEGSIGSFRRQRQAAQAVAGSFDNAKTAAERFRDEINRVNAVLSKRSSFRDYQQALDDFTKSVKENGKTLDITTQKGRDNQAALDGIASSALAVAQNLKGADRAKFLAQARKDFLDAADDIGLTNKAAKDLADRLGLLDRVRARPKVYVDGIPKSLAQLEAVAAELRNLHDKTIRLTTVRTTGGRVLPGSADGGTVHGQRAPYGDKVLTMLAPGEEVISNRFGQADQFRPLLKAINDRRYADGGTVAQSRISVNVAGASVARNSGGDIDYGRLASAMAALRPAPPLYGAVNIQPHNYSEFKRQMEQDRALANLSGARHG